MFYDCPELVYLRTYNCIICIKSSLSYNLVEVNLQNKRRHKIKNSMAKIKKDKKHF